MDLNVEDFRILTVIVEAALKNNIEEVTEINKLLQPRLINLKLKEESKNNLIEDFENCRQSCLMHVGIISFPYCKGKLEKDILGRYEKIKENFEK